MLKRLEGLASDGTGGMFDLSWFDTYWGCVVLGWVRFWLRLVMFGYVWLG
jgi:hypothetical protein